MLACLYEKLFNAEALVLRHGQVLHTVAVDELFYTLDQCLKKVYGDVVIMWEVGVTLDGGEVIPEKKFSCGNGTYTSLFDLYLAANVAAVMTYLARS